MKTLLVTTRYLKNGNIEFFSRAYLPTPEAKACRQAAEWCSDTWGGGWYDEGTKPMHLEAEVNSEALCEAYPDREDLILATARICALEAISAGAPAIPEGALFGEWSQGKDALDGDYDFLGEVAGACSPEEIDLFSEGYLKELFHESDCEDGPKTPWQDLKLTDGNRDVPPTSEEGQRQLRGYRKNGYMNGYWLCSLSRLDACEDRSEDPADLGPTVDLIDWAGIDDLTSHERDLVEERGANDGIADVENVLCEQGTEVLRDCQKPGCLDWDNAARNAGAFEISLPIWRESQEARELYYAAYAKAADERAEEILKEADAEEAA